MPHRKLIALTSDGNLPFVGEVVDLFCGVGGLTHGLHLAGLTVKAGFDIDPACKYPYEANNEAQFQQADVFALTGNTINKIWEQGPRILVGCAPCQTFSTYSMGKKQASDKDKRWKLISEFQRLVLETQPDIVSMENVPRAQKAKTFLEFIAFLETNGYRVSQTIVSCEDYGVPQRRKRLVLLASKFGELTLSAGKSETPITVRDAIGHLPRIEQGTNSVCDPLHYSSRLSAINLQRVQASKPGGTWNEWPDELKLDCHRRESGKTYRSVYGRMSYDEPAPTLTTLCLGVGNGRYTHPEQDRGISIREAALLQSFPEHYKFVESGLPVKPRVLSRLIGNAVPVNLGRAIGESIVNHIKSSRP